MYRISRICRAIGYPLFMVGFILFFLFIVPIVWDYLIDFYNMDGSNRGFSNSIKEHIQEIAEEGKLHLDILLIFYIIGFFICLIVFIIVIWDYSNIKSEKRCEH